MLVALFSNQTPFIRRRVGVLSTGFSVRIQEFTSLGFNFVSNSFFLMAHKLVLTFFLNQLTGRYYLAIHPLPFVARRISRVPIEFEHFTAQRVCNSVVNY